MNKLNLQKREIESVHHTNLWLNGRMMHGRGFCQCGYIEYDRETSNLHSRLQETIKKRVVPEEVIRGVNKFLEEMMALQLDEESPDEEVELSENCTANVNENDDRESDEDNYSEENEGVESDDDEINVVDLQ